jgi:hypothetical protein
MHFKTQTKFDNILLFLNYSEFFFLLLLRIR